VQPPRPVIPPAVLPSAAPAVSGALALDAAREPAAAPRPAPPAGPPPPRRSDFATVLGPRLLVGTGALACVVFLALFVKFAWESNWVGPAGRVLMGAATSVALVAGGLRLMGGRYRPLGQGLAAAGLAGLYVSAFAAHGFYELVSRELAFVLMAAITANAVLLAARLPARLLAALAWTSAYLTPVLLSTGEDKAAALFLYLALVDLGALALDHWRPWPETAPLAAAGTVVLYAGWFGTFYSAARFATAAAGLVLFTALFAAGMARKRRDLGTGAVVAASTLGLLVLAASSDRPWPLALLSLSLAAAAFLLAGRLGVPAGVLALAAGGAPFLAWSLSHYRADSFAAAATWITGGLLLFLVAPFLRRTPGETRTGGGGVLTGLALAAAGLVSAFLAESTDWPLGLSALLLAQAGVAIVARSRWAWAEPAGVAGAALTTAVWLGAFFEAGRRGDAWLVAFPTAAAYLLAFVARGLIARSEVKVADVFAQLANAGLVWITLFHALYETAPGALALASVALATLYLVIGLAAVRERPEAALLARTALGLAAVFLTVAIPVRLGLHGITLAWALEGLLLVALGRRYGSVPARAFGYAVLVLASARLLVRHFPLRGGEPFTPGLNAAFGTWLLVILCVAAGAFLARRVAGGHALDSAVALVFPVAALALLFAVLTHETGAAFDQAARSARRAGDLARLEQARLGGRFALSLLWTLFATGLLAGGLGARSRPLFYAGYALFAVTALKVVLVDTATLHTLYRMLSFLALGLLLLAGAFLNLRFRERLLPRGSEP
jgi:uncharacterized membrane protein